MVRCTNRKSSLAPGLRADCLGVSSLKRKMLFFVGCETSKFFGPDCQGTIAVGPGVPTPHRSQTTSNCARLHYFPNIELHVRETCQSGLRRRESHRVPWDILWDVNIASQPHNQIHMRPRRFSPETLMVYGPKRYAGTHGRTQSSRQRRLKASMLDSLSLLWKYRELYE